MRLAHETVKVRELWGGDWRDVLVGGSDSRYLRTPPPISAPSHLPPPRAKASILFLVYAFATLGYIMPGTFTNLLYLFKSHC